MVRHIDNDQFDISLHLIFVCVLLPKSFLLYFIFSSSHNAIGTKLIVSIYQTDIFLFFQQFIFYMIVGEVYTKNGSYTKNGCFEPEWLGTTEFTPHLVVW